MKGFGIRIVLALALNAVALWIASLLLDKMSINGASFILAVIIFTVASLVATPITHSVVKDRLPALTFLVSLIGTFLALLITDLLSDGLDIEGGLTWVLATVIVWLATVVLEMLTRNVGRPSAQRT
jgi:hypothetical protein